MPGYLLKLTRLIASLFELVWVNAFTQSNQRIGQWPSDCPDERHSNIWEKIDYIWGIAITPLPVTFLYKSTLPLLTEIQVVIKMVRRHLLKETSQPMRYNCIRSESTNLSTGVLMSFPYEKWIDMAACVAFGLHVYANVMQFMFIRAWCCHMFVC